MRGKFIVWIAGAMLLFLPVLAHSGQITVTSPTGGDTWYIGGTYTITWTTDIAPDKDMAIKLLDEHGNKILDIAKPTANDGHEDWTIPSSVSAGDYIIRVKRKGGTAKGDSAVFTIAGPRIEVTKPGSGDTWSKGDSFQIRWRCYGNPGDHVNISLYTSGGSKVKDLASSVSNNCIDSTCSHTCPASAISGVAAGSYKVVVETTDHNFSDESPLFSITETGGESEGSEGGEPGGGTGRGALGWLDPHKFQKINLRVPESLIHGIKPPPPPGPDPWWKVNLGDLINALKQKGTPYPVIVELMRGGKMVTRLVKLYPNGTVRSMKGVQLMGGLAKFKLPRSKAQEVAKAGGGYRLVLRNAKTGEALRTIPIRSSSGKSPVLKRPLMMKRPGLR